MTEILLNNIGRYGLYFLGISLVLFIILIVLYFKLLNVKSRYNKKIKKVEDNLKKEVAFLEEEIKRLNYLLVELKKTKKQNSVDNTDNIDVSNILVEKKNLEIEKQELKEKTKKLWEQSIAIHKEKERIDILRRDIERRHKEITDSITYARRIQTALLPSKQEISSVFKEFFVFYQPRDIVSGDFYWIDTDDKRTIFVVADCTGHGVPGAFMSLLGISFLNEIMSKNKYLKANHILEQLRNLIKQSLSHYKQESQAKDGMDMALIIIDHKTDIMQFAGANNPIYIVNNNELSVFKATKSPVGSYINEKKFENKEIKLNIGDKIYMFSDGFADQFGGPKGRKFTYKRFKEILLDMNQRGFDMEKQGLAIAEIFNGWKEGYKQIDDVLVTGIMYTRV